MVSGTVSSTLSSSSSSRARAPSSTLHGGSRSTSSRASFGSQSGKRLSIGSSNGAGAQTEYAGVDKHRTVGAAAPFQSITNRTNPSSHDEEYRSMSMKQRNHSHNVNANADAGEQDSSFERARGPRSSQGTVRSVGSGGGGGGSRVPSALRRLPPAGSRVASRSILPSGGAHSSSYGTDPSGSSSTQHPSSSGSSGPARPGVSALARANGRRSLGATLNAAGSGGAAQHERDGREITKLTVDSTSFEEWMKMATDNKINATNTWNFALIDYFHDMSLLRSDNGDGSINFQKASCTLDGCVKVWTSRVDSVVVETGKLLSGLQDDANANSSKNSRTRNDDDDGEGADEDGEHDGQGPRRKRNRAREPTLAKSFNQLAVKKLDLEFTVDPLFKKTSADFDEGGAGGLLMNHLGVDSKARVVFDASDVPGQDDVDEERSAPAAAVMEDREIDEDDDEDASDSMETARNEFDDQEQVDLGKLRAKLFGQHDVAGAEDALGELLHGMTVCPTFAMFRFAPDDNTLFSSMINDNEAGPSSAPYSSELPAANDWTMALDDVQDFGQDDDMDNDGLNDAFGGLAMPSGPSGGFYGAEDDGFDLGDNNLPDGAMDLGYENAARGPEPTGGAPIDFTTSLQGLLEASSDQGFEGDDFFGYFDQRMNKNWAGPEHWKMRNMAVGAPGQLGAKANGEKTTTARKQKEPFLIDFTSDETAIASKVLFEKAATQASTLLPSGEKYEDLYLLPEDRHYSSRQLLRLFIKPRSMLNPRRTGQQVHEALGMPRTDVDADYWIQAAAQNGASGEMGALGFDAGEDGGLADAPFDTQFFHEDDGGFDPMEDAVENAMTLEPEDEELATQALKRIRPEYVNYAKKAKQVDIRKLKENIWRELAIVADKDDEDEDVSGESGNDSGGANGESLAKDDDVEQEMALDGPDKAKNQIVKREPTDPRTFDNVLSGLRKLYSKDRMDEISTSFCFICLLHLANEEGLRIRTAPNGLGGLGMLAGRPIVEDDEEEEENDDDADNKARRSVSRDVFGASVHDTDEADADKGRVGYLEQLSIAKDPNAGRSA